MTVGGVLAAILVIDLIKTSVLAIGGKDRIVVLQAQKEIGGIMNQEVKIQKTADLTVKKKSQEKRLRKHKSLLEAKDLKILNKVL